jgi:hypothetical protein
MGMTFDSSQASGSSISSTHLATSDMGIKTRTGVHLAFTSLFQRLTLRFALAPLSIFDG